MEPAFELAILNVPMGFNDAGARTVGQYLAELLLKVWQHGEGFSGKKPFGNSGWEWDIYAALGQANIVAITLDEDGFIDDMTDEERAKADELIAGAIVASLWRDLP